MSWHLSKQPSGREATIAHIIETIDKTSPETKEELAAHLDLSVHYLSEILLELKSEDIVSKSYVIDDKQVYDSVDTVSTLPTEAAEKARENVLNRLLPLHEVALQQYRASFTAFRGEKPEQTAGQLESITNERYRTVLSELRSYTLSTEWPGNRVAADLASIAKDIEIIGDRACYISDIVTDSDSIPHGSIEERIVSVFESGEEIAGYAADVLFETDIEQITALHDTEQEVHRQLSELFELATAYDIDAYGNLVALTRTLERIIHYWVKIGESAVELHTGLDAGHVEL